MSAGKWGAAVMAAGVLVLAGCGQSPEEQAAASASSSSAAAQLAEALVSKVRYEVGGDTTQASITIQTPSGSSQQNDIDVPLKTKEGGYPYLEFTFSAGDFVYLSAQNSKGYGTVTCRITTDDGEVIAENSASGGYAIASCSGKAR